MTRAIIFTQTHTNVHIKRDRERERERDRESEWENIEKKIIFIHTHLLTFKHIVGVHINRDREREREREGEKQNKYWEEMKGKVWEWIYISI